MNEPRFGPGALRLVAIAAQALGWRPEEFWRATPAELVTALAPPATGATNLGRDDLNRMMEQDHA